MSETGRNLRVLVAEDSPVARQMIVYILNGDPELQVVGEARDGIEAVELTPSLRPDVIVMDIMMPGLNGLEAARTIMAEMPTPIVPVSAAYEPDTAKLSFEALHAGAVPATAYAPGSRPSRYRRAASRIAQHG